MFEIRLARAEDCRQMLDIYTPIIENTITSFEYQVPSVEDFKQRVLKTLETYPWLVCTRDDQVAGYAYGGSHRSREAYQWSVELSVYVHPGFHRKGVAGTLYRTLMTILKLQGYYTALAGISLPNQGSVKFHEALGFEPVGIYNNVGYKFDQWHATGWWQRPLQPYKNDVVQPVSINQIHQTTKFQAVIKSATNELAIKDNK